MKNALKLLPVLAAVFAASCTQTVDDKQTSAPEQKTEIKYDAVVYSPKGDTVYHAVVEEGDYSRTDYGAKIKDPATGEYFSTTAGTPVTFRPFSVKK